jgi:hypothetical protein
MSLLRFGPIPRSEPDFQEFQGKWA